MKACKTRYSIFIIFVSLSVITHNGVAQNITRFAGNLTSGYSGNGGPATSAQLYNPGGLYHDNKGNIFIADEMNHVIRVVNAAGIISNFAGTGGVRGYSGDGGMATEAKLWQPSRITFDNSGNAFIVDQLLSVIRKISPTGIITTITGNLPSGYSGDGGLLKQAQLSRISDIAFDNAGNLYIADMGNNVIRKVNTANIITTIAGNGTNGFSGDGGPATSAQFSTPTGILVDNAGNIYISDTGNERIRKINSAGIITTFAGSAVAGYRGDNGPATLASLHVPGRMSIDYAGNVYVADTRNSAVRKISTSGIITTVAGNGTSGYSGDGGPATAAQLASPTDITIDNAGILYISNMNPYPCVRKMHICASPVTPAVSITPSTNDVCFGTPITFTATPVNGGISPTYTWVKNGISLRLNSATYTDKTLQDGDLIHCIMTPAPGCLTASTAASADVTLKIHPLTQPTVTITSSAVSICPGTAVTFSAATVYGGSAPFFQWAKNGKVVGFNSNTYADNNIVHGDVLQCTLISNSTCITTPKATSNTIGMSVYKNPVVTLDHKATLCMNSSRALDAGKFNVYVWNDGSTNQTLSVSSTGKYYVAVTDNHGCHGSDTTIINTMLPGPAAFLPPDTAICSYGSVIIQPTVRYAGYLWDDNTMTAARTIKKTGTYWLQVTDVNGCSGKDSITILPKYCLEGFFVPTAFSPNNNGKNDVFKPVVLGNIVKYQFRIFNRWGQVVFQTADPDKGWDGRVAGNHQGHDAFAWICEYQFEGNQLHTEKGTVVIVR